MSDREGAITGLQTAIGLTAERGQKIVSLRIEHADAILTLLKEQEPRVLTWDEVKKAEVCWLEDRGYKPFATLEADTWNPEKYDKSYRCWNRMPTDEQRKAVKWNDP